jgi:hypothetical protein
MPFSWPQIVGEGRWETEPRLSSLGGRSPLFTLMPRREVFSETAKATLLGTSESWRRKNTAVFR